LKQFRFRLQNYLNLKEQQEKIYRLKLARAQAEYQREAETLVKIQDNLKELLKRNREARRGPIQIELIALGERYLQFQSEQKERQALAAAETRKKLLQLQEEFLDHCKEKKSLERLRERVWSSYYEEYLREEQKYLDEIGSICFLKT